MAKQMCTITQVNKKLDISKIDNRCPTVKQYNDKTINNNVISIKGRKDDQLFPIDEMILTHIFNLTVTINSERDDEDLMIYFSPENVDDVEWNLWEELGVTEFLDDSVVEVVKQSFTDNQWLEQTYVKEGLLADMYWTNTLKIVRGDITKSIAISESAVKDNFIKSFKINDFEIIGNKLEKDKYIFNFIFNNPKDTSRPEPFNPIIMEINAGTSRYPSASVYLDKYNVEVKNPTAMYRCTAYIQYNGSIAERDSTDLDTILKLKGTFESTYKLVYEPDATPDGSTLYKVERLSFDIYMQDGSPYYPAINDIVVLGSGVKINKFESHSSVFNSMKLYYPNWSESENKYNMRSITAPLEQIF